MSLLWGVSWGESESQECFPLETRLSSAQEMFARYSSMALSALSVTGGLGSPSHVEVPALDLQVSLQGGLLPLVSLASSLASTVANLPSPGLSDGSTP